MLAAGFAPRTFGTSMPGRLWHLADFKQSPLSRRYRRHRGHWRRLTKKSRQADQQRRWCQPNGVFSHRDKQPLSPPLSHQSEPPPVVTKPKAGPKKRRRKAKSRSKRRPNPRGPKRPPKCGPPPKCPPPNWAPPPIPPPFPLWANAPVVIVAAPSATAEATTSMIFRMNVPPGDAATCSPTAAQN